MAWRRDADELYESQATRGDWRNHHVKTLSRDELSAAQRKPALLADGMIPPTLNFIKIYSRLCPELAG